MRALSRENPDVLEALAKQQCAEMARERKRRAAVADADARTLQLVKLNSELRGASEALKQKRKAIADAEALLEAKHALKSFSPQGTCPRRQRMRRRFCKEGSSERPGSYGSLGHGVVAPSEE